VQITDKEHGLSERSESHLAALPPIRTHLFAGALLFVQAASGLPGVSRIALLGSLATAKANPKDIDLLVTVADDADLTQLAALGRKLQGHAQGRNAGADIFLASPHGAYIGRTCHWKVCKPGVRMSCDAYTCGVRPYLHDDFDAVTLQSDLVANPPIVLWPQVSARVTPPADVERILLAPLRTSQARPTVPPRRLGKQEPRYQFLLNPFRDRRFAICPGCDERTLLRKVPLVIHVDPRNPVAINKSCRYCPHCDLLIAHRNELEAELAALFAQRAPELVGNAYLVMGTLDRAVWKRGKAEPLSIVEMREQLHDFVRVMSLERSGIWSGGGDAR
jgi:hypothetical protein